MWDAVTAPLIDDDHKDIFDGHAGPVAPHCERTVAVRLPLCDSSLAAALLEARPYRFNSAAATCAASSDSPASDTSTALSAQTRGQGQQDLDRHGPDRGLGNNAGPLGRLARARRRTHPAALAADAPGHRRCRQRARRSRGTAPSAYRAGGDGSGSTRCTRSALSDFQPPCFLRCNVG